jgi:hypothetical protein
MNVQNNIDSNMRLKLKLFFIDQDYTYSIADVLVKNLKVESGIFLTQNLIDLHLTPETIGYYSLFAAL